jgi:hypothetical protein
LGEAGPPEHYRFAIDRQLLRNGVIGLAIGGGQHDAATQGHLLRSAVGASPLLNLLSVVVVQS